MTTTNLAPCLCSSRRLLTVKQARAAVPELENISLQMLYDLIAAEIFPTHKISERKNLILITERCDRHNRKPDDDVDRWLAKYQPPTAA